MTRLIFTSFAALLLSALLAPVATARTHTTTQSEAGLPTMRVLNQYNPRDHERDWQPNSPSHDIVSDRRTIEESQSVGAQMLDARDTDTGVF